VRSTFTTFSRIYSAYAFVIVVAFWIYYTSTVFIVGTEFGKLFDERVEEKQKLIQQQEPPPDSEV